METNCDIKELLSRLGIAGDNLDLYRLAFTHRSYNGWAGTRGVDYERLEFLGDSVVNLVSAELCYTLHPDMAAGELTKLRSQFICTAAEADYARSLGLGEYLILGPSMDEKQKDADNFLEDIFESFLGAIYLDQGADFAMEFVRKLLKDKVKNAFVQNELNPKSTLQEAVQGDKGGELAYSIIKEWGEPNRKHFIIGVYLDGMEIGRGEGTSKKMAERNAALSALKKMAV